MSFNRSKSLILVACMTIACMVSSTTQAQWSDDFESYTPGTVLHGVGGWEGWDNVPGVAGVVSDAQARSGSNSMAVIAGTDAIHQFSGITSGRWTFTAWQYIPSGLSGDVHFLVQNIYNHGGPYEWTIEIDFVASSGMVTDPFRPATTTPQPIVFDQWVEVVVEIDLDADTQVTYYNGAQVSDGVYTVRGGPREIANLDLFSDAATGGGSCFWDDISLDPIQGDCLELDVPLLVAGGNTTFTVRGDAGQTVAILYSTRQGSYQLNRAGWCLDLGLRLPADPRDNVVCQGVIQANREFSCTKRIPNVHGVTVFLQAAARGTCPTPCQSEVVERLIP